MGLFNAILALLSARGPSPVAYKNNLIWYLLKALYRSLIKSRWLVASPRLYPVAFSYTELGKQKYRSICSVVNITYSAPVFFTSLAKVSTFKSFTHSSHDVILF